MSDVGIWVKRIWRWIFPEWHKSISYITSCNLKIKSCIGRFMCKYNVLNRKIFNLNKILRSNYQFKVLSQIDEAYRPIWWMPELSVSKLMIFRLIRGNGHEYRASKSEVWLIIWVETKFTPFYYVVKMHLLGSPFYSSLLIDGPWKGPWNVASHMGKRCGRWLGDNGSSWDVNRWLIAVLCSKVATKSGGLHCTTLDRILLEDHNGDGPV